MTKHTALLLRFSVAFIRFVAVAYTPSCVGEASVYTFLNPRELPSLKRAMDHGFFISEKKKKKKFYKV